MITKQDNAWEFEADNFELDTGEDVLAKPFWGVAQKNARLMASLMEPLLCHLFSNLEPATNTNDYYDLLLNGKETVEVRTVTDKSLISFESSANVGAGRDGVNKAATEAKIANVDYWVSCNISRFPKIEVTTYRGEQVRNFIAKQGKQRQHFTLNQMKGL